MAPEADLAGTVALLALAGASHSLLTVATRTLLQRSVPPQLIGRVFGIPEGFTMAGFALGALLVPALMHLGGSRLALLGVAAVLPLAAVTGGRAVLRLDAGTSVPVVEIGAAALASVVRRTACTRGRGPRGGPDAYAAARGAVLIRLGEPGDAYYAIAEGELDALQDGRLLCRRGRGEGVGEIALLRAIPRTATVIARTAASVYEIHREPFLTAVLGHAPTLRQAAHRRCAAGRRGRIMRARQLRNSHGRGGLTSRPAKGPGPIAARECRDGNQRRIAGVVLHGRTCEPLNT